MADVAQAAAFYAALGWERATSGGDEITWFKLGGAALGLFGREALAADANLPTAPRQAFNGVTLAINVASEAEVAECLSAARSAGARILKPATRAEWGGLSGYFADLDGHAWEIAHNPFFPIRDDGSIDIP